MTTTASDAEGAEKRGEWIEAAKLWQGLLALPDSQPVKGEIYNRWRENRMRALSEISASDTPAVCARRLGGDPEPHGDENVVVHCPREGFTLRTDGFFFFLD